MGQTAKEILECFENSWGNYNPVLVGNTDTYVIGEYWEIGHMYSRGQNFVWFAVLP